jgi:hypothetical protein
MPNIISETENIDSDLPVHTFLDEVPLIKLGNIQI